MIHFDRLTPLSAERIVDLEFAKLARRYRDIHGIEVVLTRSARAELIRRGFSPVFGARHLAAVLDSVCNVEVAKRLPRGPHLTDGGSAEILAWLREIRAGTRPFDAGEVRRRVLERTRARTGYSTLEIDYADGAFGYHPVGDSSP
jgi:hypothetical protein